MTVKEHQRGVEGDNCCFTAPLPLLVFPLWPNSIHSSLCKCHCVALQTPQHPSPRGNATASAAQCIDPIQRWSWSWSWEGVTRQGAISGRRYFCGAGFKQSRTQKKTKTTTTRCQIQRSWQRRKLIRAQRDKCSEGRRRRKEKKPDIYFSFSVRSVRLPVSPHDKEWSCLRLMAVLTVQHQISTDVAQGKDDFADKRCVLSVNRRDSWPPTITCTPPQSWIALMKISHP